MIRFFILMATFATLTGCVSPMALQDQAPGVSYANPSKVLIAVIDERTRVEEGKPGDFIGVAHATFGIPVDWHVNQILATEDGDKDKDLAEWLQHRIVTGLNQKGWTSEEVDLDALPSIFEAKNALGKNNATSLVVLVLSEWYFSVNLNWVSSFNFDSDTNVHIFHAKNGQVLAKKFKERDVIEEKSDQSPQNNILGAYREQLKQILNDEEVKQKLALRTQ